MEEIKGGGSSAKIFDPRGGANDSPVAKLKKKQASREDANDSVGDAY